MPRHPPIALSSLSPNQNDQQQKIYLKMLASTIQFSNNNPIEHPPTTSDQPAQDRTQHETPTPEHAKACPGAGNFRTQQRAHPTPPTTNTHVPHPPRQVVLAGITISDIRLDQCFHKITPGIPRTTNGHERNNNPSTQKRIGLTGSLERR